MNPMEVKTSFAPDSIGWTMILPEKEPVWYFEALTELYLNTVDSIKQLYNDMEKVKAAMTENIIQKHLPKNQ